MNLSIARLAKLSPASPETAQTVDLQKFAHRLVHECFDVAAEFTNDPTGLEKALKDRFII